MLNVLTSGGSVTCCSEQIPTSYQAPAASIVLSMMGWGFDKSWRQLIIWIALLHIIHPARWPIIEKYIQSQDFAWLGVPQLSSTLAGFLLGRILGQQFSSSSTDGCSLMWIVSSRFVNVVSPPNARCSFLLLLLLHMTYDERDDMCTTISGSGYRTSALPNLNCKNTKAIEGFQGSKKKSMDAKHFIRYVYMSIWL